MFTSSLLLDDSVQFTNLRKQNYYHRAYSTIGENSSTGSSTKSVRQIGDPADPSTDSTVCSCNGTSHHCNQVLRTTVSLCPNLVHSLTNMQMAVNFLNVHRRKFAARSTKNFLHRLDSSHSRIKQKNLLQATAARMAFALSRAHRYLIRSDARARYLSLCFVSNNKSIKKPMIFFLHCNTVFVAKASSMMRTLQVGLSRSYLKA